MAVELKIMKDDHARYLMSALDLEKRQSFSEDSLERYELLQAIARGEKIRVTKSHAAKYLLEKHGKIEAFICIHPEGHLVFALPMTKQALIKIEPLVKAKKSWVFSFL